MAIATWSSRFETGIELIDAQHRTLFEAVNQLGEAYKAGTARSQVVESLAFLAGYTVEHFQTEERFMREEGYPGLDAHAAEHARLVEQVQGLRARLAAGEPLTMDVTIFLVDWLTHHISEADMGYVRFMKEKQRE